MTAADQGTRPDLRAALVPFAWLGAAIAASSLLACAALAFAPTLLSGSQDLVGWNPFASAVEVELPGAEEAGLASLAQALEAALPGSLVECGLDDGADDGAPWVLVVAQADAAELVREVTELARERGQATGSFTMGPNLARVAGRIFTEPGSAAAGLLPIALFSGSGVLLVLGYVLRRRLKPVAPSPAREGAARRLGLGVALGLVLALTIAALSELAARLGAPITEQPWLRASIQAGGWPRLAVLFVVVLLAPLGEEIFFRGYLLPALERALGPAGAILLSALAFAGIHGNAPALPAYLVYGIALAVAARRSGSLHVPIAAHVTVNCVAVVALFWSS